MNTPMRAAAMAAVLSLAVAPAALAQVSRSTPGQPEARTAMDLMPAKAKLKVTTPAFKDGEQIPFENTQYRSNTFPGLTWTKGPAATKSYVLIMQDNSLLLRGAPILHWTLFNIPANVTKLDAGMAPTGNPPGSSYGPNYMGAAKPYTGPRTPPGPGDNYHFQIFALDTTIPDEGKSSYEAITTAMNGHVLASGEVVGHGIADPNAPPPAPRPAAPAPK
ncbi:MAG TPA: YbhB/YbcL family Raf kinase inhibitor-like protein [Phenylobacterium sp.]